MPRSALVSDFDGTITENDFYSLIVDRCMGPGAPDYLEQYRRGQMKHVEAMQAYFSHAPSDPEALEALLRDTNPDPDLVRAVDELDRAGWDLIVVSAGSSWYIERILHPLGIVPELHANPGRIVEGRGLQLDLSRSTPFFSESVGIDKAAVVRDALSRYTRVAFAGDGPPDVPAALLVKPELRFARAYLAQELRRRGEAYREFTRWSEVAVALAQA
jgi:2,3-diketo-5-methylthio-1-phosphopentane phosphatase